MIKISLIAAVAGNGVIGRQNKLPWRLPGDLKFFRQVTMGKPMIMGRLTYESIGKPLPGRINIVVSSNPDWSAEGVEVCPSIDEALKKAITRAASCRAAEVLVIGGEQIYRQLMPQATRLYLTRVDDSPEGDAYFPSYDVEQWHETLLGRVKAQGDVPGYQFTMLDRLF